MPPFRSGRARKLGATGLLLTLGLLGFAAIAATPSPKPPKAEAASKAPPSLTSIPLPIGQEAKGLVLPDFDTEGRLRARLEAGIAKRIDQDHIQFVGLKLTTFNVTSGQDLLIDMPVSTLDLNTRVVTSKERTTVRRTDFHISGDAMRFDTVARTGTLTGNVKMVITDQAQLRGKAGE